MIVISKNIIKRTHCEMYQQCRLRLHPFTTQDMPNAAAHLGFRMVHSLLSWCVLGMDIGRGLFAAMFLFTVPLFMDCVKFTPLTVLREYIRIVELTITGIWCVLSILGLFGVFTINEASMTISTSENFIGFSLSGIPISTLWLCMGTVFLVTVVDWLMGDYWPKLERG